MVSNVTLLITREQNATSRVIERVNNAKAAGTKAVYDSKQLEFLDWCRLNYPHEEFTKETVTETKLLTFLEEEVIGRPPRKKGRKRKFIFEDHPESNENNEVNDDNSESDLNAYDSNNENIDMNDNNSNSYNSDESISHSLAGIDMISEPMIEVSGSV